MDALTVRWHLHNYHSNKDMIIRLKSELVEYRLMDGVKAQIITGMPISYSPQSKIELVLTTEYDYKGNMYELFDYIKQLEAELDKLMRIDLAITKIYATLKEPARSIIEMRYFIKPQTQDVRQRKYNWQEIANEVERTELNCRKIDCRVVRQIQVKILRRLI